MGSRAKQTQTSTSTTTLPENQQGNVDLLQGAAKDLFLSGGPQYYGGNTVAGATPNLTAGRDSATGYATGAGSGFIDSYQGGEKFWLNPSNIFNPSNIPGFRQAQEGVTQQVNQNLQRNILPSIRSGNVATGSLGGSRGAITEGLAIGDTSAALGRTLADMNMQAYGQGLNMYNNAASRAPTTYGMGLAPSNTLMQVGTDQRNDVQREIDAAMQKFNFEQLRPLLNAQTLQALTGTAGQYGGTNTTESTSSVSGGGSGIMQGLGGLMTLLPMMYGAKGGGVPA